MGKFLRKILVVAVSLTMIFAFTSCSNPEKEASEAVDATLKVLQTGDLEKSAAALKGIDNLTNIFESSTEDNEKSNVEQAKEIFKEIFTNLTYEIVKSEVKDDTTVNVTTKFKNVNMKNVMANWYKDVFEIAFNNYNKDEKEISKLMMNSFSKQVDKAVKNKDFKESEVAIEVVKTKNGWVMNPDETALDAITGGFVKASKELAN